MTRPIYEPNPQRQGASLEFGQQQLYRRPAPTPTATGTVYAMISSVSNQSDAFPADSVKSFDDYWPPTDGFTTDSTVLELVSAGVIGIKVKTPGYVVATCRALGWDRWTGAGNEVTNAVKGCSPAYFGSDILGVSYGLSNFASAVSNGANEGDLNTTLTDSAIISTANTTVQVAVIHHATVDALITQLDLHVAWLAEYPGAGSYVNF